MLYRLLRRSSTNSYVRAVRMCRSEMVGRSVGNARSRAVAATCAGFAVSIATAVHVTQQHRSDNSARIYIIGYYHGDKFV